MKKRSPKKRMGTIGEDPKGRDEELHYVRDGKQTRKKFFCLPRKGAGKGLYIGEKKER